MNRVSIGSDNGLSPIRRQAIIWTNAGVLSIEPLGINFNEILIKIQHFSFTKMHLKISSAKWKPFCSGRNELTVLRWHIILICIFRHKPISHHFTGNISKYIFSKETLCNFTEVCSYEPMMDWYRTAHNVLCAGNSTVTGEFSSQRPVTRSFDVFFDLRLNKRLSKQSRRRWFETPSHSLSL